MPVPEQRQQARPDLRNVPALVDHRQPEPRAEVRASLPDPVEEAEVLGEAAERDVLAVVRRRLGIAVARGQRLDGPAERRPRLVEDDLLPRVDELERCSEPRQPAAHDRDSHRSSPFATTASFCGAESRVLPEKTSNEFASIRSSVAR